MAGHHPMRTTPPAPSSPGAPPRPGTSSTPTAAPLALSKDPWPLLACLRCERHEPGFIRRIMDRNEPCDLASLSPDLAAVERAKAQAEARAQAHAKAQREALAARLALMKRPDRLDLDDFPIAPSAPSSPSRDPLDTPPPPVSFSPLHPLAGPPAFIQGPLSNASLHPRRPPQAPKGFRPRHHGPPPLPGRTPPHRRRGGAS